MLQILIEYYRNMGIPKRAKVQLEIELAVLKAFQSNIPASYKPGT